MLVPFRLSHALRLVPLAPLLALGCVTSGGCGGEKRVADEPIAIRMLEPLATGREQRERLCGRDSNDLVIDIFCSESRPEVRSFLDLRRALGMESNRNSIEQGFALTGHSTSLVSRAVSAINPRVVFIRRESETEELLALAFARGERFSEAAVRDRTTGEFQFYLFSFTLPCDDEPEGCSPGDLLTEAVETDWTSLDVYAEQDLENTPLDCLVCHQTEGPGTEKILRMQEFEPPWNHWLYRLSVGGRALLADYDAAKGDEEFAGLSRQDIEGSQPGLLSAALYFAGSGDQPNAFLSAQIEAEVVESAAARGGDQPTDNSVPGESDEWERIYERAKRGEAISVPYHDVKVTDPDKLATMTEGYVNYREGRLERDELPDLRDIFPDDQERLARIGFATEPGLDGEGVLLQACSQCHNDRLNQNVSRSLFNVDVSRLDREEKRRAMARITLPPDNPAIMPPARIRTLSQEARDALIELLER